MRLSLIGLVLLTSTAAFGQLDWDDSDYGGVATPPPICLDGCALMEQVFQVSNQAPFDVFSFLINTDINNFTLTLTGAAPFTAPQLFINGKQVGAYGALMCNNTANNSVDAQCGNLDPSGQLAPGSPTLNSSGDKIQFDVTGTNSATNPFVFFVVEPDPIDPNATYVPGSPDAAATVKATLESNIVSTPEPTAVPLITFALLWFALLGRRSSLRLL